MIGTYKVGGQSHQTLSDIIKLADESGVPGDRHVRFSNGKRLHVRERFAPSMTNLKAWFGNKAALEKQKQMHRWGADAVKSALRHEYGEKIAKDVFKMMSEKHSDSVHGAVTISQLHEMQEAASTLAFQDPDWEAPKAVPKPTPDNVQKPQNIPPHLKLKAAGFDGNINDLIRYAYDRNHLLRDHSRDRFVLERMKEAIDRLPARPTIDELKHAADAVMAAEKKIAEGRTSTPHMSAADELKIHQAELDKSLSTRLPTAPHRCYASRRPGADPSARSASPSS